MFDFLKIKQTVQTLADELANLRAQIETKKQRFEFLTSAPQAPEDRADQIDARIDAAGAEWPERLRAQLEPLQRKPLREVDAKAFPLLAITGKPDTIANFAHLEAAMFALFGDQIKRAVRERIMSWDATGCGPRLAERKAEIAKLDEEIAVLERREAQLIEDARQVGVRL